MDGFVDAFREGNAALACKNNQADTKED